MEVERRAFAATWRDEETGEIVGTTWGGTMCLRPNRPWALSIGDDAWRFPAPCGECPGCLEFQRRRLADRLKAKYGCVRGVNGDSTTSAESDAATAGTKYSDRLWLIRIYVAAEFHTWWSHRLHRRRALELEPGMYRLGTESFAVLARSRHLLPQVLRRLGLRHRVEPIRLSRGRRAWRALTAGLLVSRTAYGKQVKRWYARGLPPAERDRWKVEKVAMARPWRKATSPRVRTGRKIILVPPEVWSLGPDAFRSYRKIAESAFTPEQAAANRRRLAMLISHAMQHSNLNAPAKPGLDREAVRQFYFDMAQRKKAGASANPAPDLSTSPSVGGGLRSSVHSSNAPPAKIVSDEELLALGPSGKPRWMERALDDKAKLPTIEEAKRQASRSKLEEALERLRKKMLGGSH